MVILMAYWCIFCIQQSCSHNEAPTAFSGSLDRTKKAGDRRRMEELQLSSSISKLDTVASHLSKKSEDMLSLVGHKNVR